MNLKDAVRTLLFKKKSKGYHQLTTVWGEKLDPDHVLEEYPRPQLVRANYTILNGYWKYNITTEKQKPGNYDGKILVPFSPESLLSGVGRQLKPNETMYYERPLFFDKIEERKRCILNFGAVDQYCEVSINGRVMAEHMGGYLPFSVDITNGILEGGNLLSVKVRDLSDSSYHSRGKQKLKRGGMFYTAQSGIWQTVWMEWVPEVYISTVQITPNYDESKVKIDISLVDEQTKRRRQGNDQKKNNITRRGNLGESINPPLSYRIDIFENKRRIASVNSHEPHISIALQKFIPWSPETPFLYHCAITVGEDRVESYFAVRKVDIQVDEKGIPRIYLNNKAYFQNGLLDQGYWPDGLYTAPSDEALIFDIEQAKALGFNMLRKHLKIEPLRWYYHCDRIGMLVWQDMVNGGEKYNQLLVGYLPTLFPGIASRIKDHHYRWFGRANEMGRREWTKECADTVSLLYNHPSVVVWVPFNEGWGQFDARKASELIRSMDSNRLIDHASGWFDQEGPDFDSIHNYFHPLGVTVQQRPEILSEFGGYACYIQEHSYSWQIYGYRIYPTAKLFDEAYHQLLEEDIQSLWKKGLSAAVYTQLSDVEDEVNGLFTYDRKICKVSKLADIGREKADIQDSFFY